MVEDSFSTSIPLAVLPRLLDLGHRYGFDPLASVEMEDYFLALLSNTSMEEIERRVIPAVFRCFGVKPEWLQGSDWPLANGRPMAFVGQVNVPADSDVRGTPAVYVFVDPESGEIRTVVQHT